MKRRPGGQARVCMLGMQAVLAFAPRRSEPAWGQAVSQAYPEQQPWRRARSLRLGRIRQVRQT